MYRMARGGPGRLLHVHGRAGSVRPGQPHAHGWLRNVAFLPITAAVGGRVVVVALACGGKDGICDAVANGVSKRDEHARGAAADACACNFSGGNTGLLQSQQPRQHRRT